MSEPGYVDASQHHHYRRHPRDTAIQSLTTLIQLHFDKTLEKKRAIDVQKKHLQKLFLLFLLLLSLLSSSSSSSSASRLQCRHCWFPISILSLSFLIFYVSVAQTLRCINEFKYQRRCHKLTLALATERMKALRRGAEPVAAEECEVEYQEPPDSYLVKFRRSWGLYFGFLVVTFGVMVSGIVVLLCF